MVITEHAVDRYVQYHSAADMKNPWASLINRMQHEDLHKIPLDPRVIEHKRRKYGPDNEVEIWGTIHLSIDMWSSRMPRLE